jgi:hypothetical protein
MLKEIGGKFHKVVADEMGIYDGNRGVLQITLPHQI